MTQAPSTPAGSRRTPAPGGDPGPSASGRYRRLLQEIAEHLHDDASAAAHMVEQEFTTLHGVAIAFERHDDEDDTEGLRAFLDLGSAPAGRELPVYAYLLQQQLRTLPRAELTVGLEPRTGRLLLGVFMEDIPGMGDLYADMLRQHLQVAEILREDIASL